MEFQHLADLVVQLSRTSSSYSVMQNCMSRPEDNQAPPPGGGAPLHLDLMPVFFIVNPAAGKRPGEVRPLAGPEAVVKILGAATRRARPRRGQAGLTVAAVGGAGPTRSPTACSRSAPPRLPARLPAGSGCDFARHFKILKPRAGLRYSGTAGSSASAGRVSWGAPLTSRYFLSIAAGLPGEVIRAMEVGKPLGGTLSYMTVTLAQLRSRAKRHPHHRRPRAPPEPYHLLAVTPHDRRGMPPWRGRQDGMLDFVAVGGCPCRNCCGAFKNRGTHPAPEASSTRS